MNMPKKWTKFENELKLKKQREDLINKLNNECANK